MNTRRSDCSELINELMKRYSVEEIAVKVGVCANTVYKWRNGRLVPMAAEKIMRGMMK